MPDARDELFSDWLRVCNRTTREPKQRLLSLSSVVLDDARNKNGNVDRKYEGKSHQAIYQVGEKSL